MVATDRLRCGAALDERVRARGMPSSECGWNPLLRFERRVLGVTTVLAHNIMELGCFGVIWLILCYDWVTCALRVMCGIMSDYGVLTGNLECIHTNAINVCWCSRKDCSCSTYD